MVERVLKLLSKDSGGISGAALILAISAFSSQILALLRDRLFAHYFGAGSTLDVYYASFRIPDFIFVCVASLVSATVLIPFIAKERASGLAQLEKFLNSVFTSFTILIVLVCGVLWLVLPRLAPYIAPGFSGVALSDYICFTRLLLFSPLFFGISNLLTSITQSEHKFLVSALSPILYNIGIISGVLVWYPLLGNTGLVLGVLVGAFLHALIQWPVVKKSGLSLRLIRHIDFSAINSVSKLSLPRTLALGMQQIVTLVLVGFATKMYVGSIAVFTFASNMQAVPVSIIGVSYSLAAFPALAKSFQSGKRAVYLEHVISAAKNIIFWSLPVTAGVIVLRAHITRLILGSGRFDWADTRLTAALVAVFAASLVAQGLILLFTRAYYAAGKTKLPLIMNLSVAILTVIFANYLSGVLNKNINVIDFVSSLLRLENLPGIAVVSLPLAFSLGSWVNALLHWSSFSKENPGFGREVSRTISESFIASFALAIVTYFSLIATASLFDQSTFGGLLVQAIISGTFGGLAWFTVLYYFGSLELTDFLNTIRAKFWKEKAYVPGAEESIIS